VLSDQRIGKTVGLPDIEFKIWTLGLSEIGHKNNYWLPSSALLIWPLLQPYVRVFFLSEMKYKRNNGLTDRVKHRAGHYFHCPLKSLLSPVDQTEKYLFFRFKCGTSAYPFYDERDLDKNSPPTSRKYLKKFVILGFPPKFGKCIIFARSVNSASLSIAIVKTSA
jgi:hypothetical protein